MPNITASIPHQYSRAEAKQRIRDGIDSLRHQHGAMLGNVQETWTDDRMDFSVQAVGQSFTGHLLVNDQFVRVEIALPWYLRMMARTITQRVEQDVRRALAGPTG